MWRTHERPWEGLVGTGEGKGGFGDEVGVAARFLRAHSLTTSVRAVSALREGAKESRRTRI